VTNVRMREDSESTLMFDFSKMRAKPPLQTSGSGGHLHLNQV
jgi:hypothetical protein